MAGFNAFAQKPEDAQNAHNTLVTQLNKWVPIVWTADNDGSGSGLDADTVDAKHAYNFVYGVSTNAATVTSSDYNPYDEWGMRPTFFYTPYVSWSPSTLKRYYGVTFANPANSTASAYCGQFIIDNSSTPNAHIRSVCAGTPSAWQQIWTDANDGAGSGLDADTLDALQSSDFFRTTGGTINGQIYLTSNADFSLSTDGGVRFGLSTDGKFGFWGATPIRRPTPWTQSYTLSTAVVAGITAYTINTTGGSASTTIAAVPAAYNQAFFQNTIASFRSQTNALYLDLKNIKDNLNKLIDDLQSVGLAG